MVLCDCSLSFSSLSPQHTVQFLQAVVSKQTKEHLLAPHTSSVQMYRTETSVKNRQESLAYAKDKQCLTEGSGTQSACNHSPCEQSPGGDHTN